MTFSVGDKAVYPVQGVTEILGIEDVEISGFTSRVYILRRLDSEDTIRVPVANVERVGLRPLVGEEQIADVFDVLAANEMFFDEPNCNRRYRRYLEKIQSGNLADVAQVLRDLHLTRQDKQLSYGERRVYDMAQDLLVQELSVAQESDEETVRGEIEQILG